MARLSDRQQVVRNVIVSRQPVNLRLCSGLFVYQFVDWRAEGAIMMSFAARLVNGVQIF